MQALDLIDLLLNDVSISCLIIHILSDQYKITETLICYPFVIFVG